MNLSAIARLLADTEPIRNLGQRVAACPAGGSVRVRLLEAAKWPVLAALLARQRAPAPQLLVVTPTLNRAREVAEILGVFSPDPELVVLLPEPGTAFYESAYSDASQVHARVAALWRASTGSARLVVAPVRALMQRVSPPAGVRRAARVLRVGQSVRPQDLADHWTAVGYTLSPIVDEPGTFARRGGILDVFPIGTTRPVRIEFFGDEIDSLRAFDAGTQRSAESVPTVTVLPAADILADNAAVDLALRADTSTLTEAARQRWQKGLEHLRLGHRFDGIDAFAGYLPAGTGFDYLVPGATVVIDEPTHVEAALRSLAEQSAEAWTHAVESGELPAALRPPHLEAAEVERMLTARARLDLSWEAAPGDDVVDLEGHITPVEAFVGRTNVAIERAIADVAAGDTVVVVSMQSQRLQELLAEQAVAVPITPLVDDPRPGSLSLVQGTLPDGFETEIVGRRLRLLTDSELFGVAKSGRATRPKPARHTLVISELEPGGYVVHVEHGVGRYGGLIRLTTDGVEREYMVIQYAGEDKLYVPVDQADRVDRYIGPGDGSPALTRLGTTDWARAKARVRAAVQEMAEELLQLYAVRETVTGHGFSPDSQWQVDLESSFPYVETPDQVEALAEIKADMERPRPMDRLLCGDVGYGKTELALRAAFKAVNDGKQVAVLVPTTVLAQQHDRTFRERLRAFPVRVEMLSRFRSEREQTAVVAGLAKGAVDICIGTHRLVQKDVHFADLGLVIIDEEQRFGVAHKERLKQLRREVDVLTLTATPIPRTLQMALTGVRDMSVMETPPEDRLPIKTYVHEYDEHQIREAILREIDRGGQIYFVHNRVQTIYTMAARLRELVPEARVAIGHGQLAEDALEQVMLDFAAGSSDVLVCSTIIESGLDIPNVNTIIVNRADTFGLAQLYQLRGRVGRSANRAFAYFLYPKGRQLSEIAEKRLRTIFEASDLGAGLKVAMRDLEIRGAGNLLGVEQHGHVASVGFHLYTQLLSEAVHRLRGQAPPRGIVTTVDLPIKAYIPDDYITDAGLRLNIYQRLAAARDPDRVGQLALELQDRFGPPPEPVLQLIYVAQIRCLASLALVESVALDGEEVVLRRPQGTTFTRDSLPRDASAWLRVGTTLLGIPTAGGPARWQARLSGLLEHLAAPPAASGESGKAVAPAGPKPARLKAKRKSG